MSLRILNFGKNSQQKVDESKVDLAAKETKTILSAEEIAAIRQYKAITAKSQSKKLSEIYESFEPTGFGLLYNYFTIQTDDLAPAGCKIPSLDDWKALFSFVSAGDDSGTKAAYYLKGARRNNNKIPYWQVSNPIPRNDLYLNFYGGGYKEATAPVTQVGTVSKYVTTDVLTQEVGEETYYDFTSVGMTYNSNDATIDQTIFISGDEEPYTYFKKFYSVRCLLDPTQSLFNQWYPGFVVTDQDGNKYGTMKIGNAIWLTSNLITKRFNTGLTIPSAYDPEFNENDSGYRFPYDTESYVGRSSQIRQ